MTNFTIFEGNLEGGHCSPCCRLILKGHLHEGTKDDRARTAENGISAVWISLASSSALGACCSITRNHSMHQVCRKVDIYGRIYEYIYTHTHTLLPHTLIRSAFQTSSAQPFRQRVVGMSSFSSRLSQVF